MMTSPHSALTPAVPMDLMPELRTDHAGETGAVWIYRGVLAITRDAALRGFAQRHLATEQEHLRLICELVPPRLVPTKVQLFVSWLQGQFGDAWWTRAP